MADMGHSTQRELANRTVACGQFPLQHGVDGCGARDWRVFSSPLLNKAAGERLLVCRQCHAECLVQFEPDSR